MNKFARGFAYCLLASATTLGCFAQEGESPVPAELFLADAGDMRVIVDKNTECKGGFSMDLALTEDQTEQLMNVNDKYFAIITAKTVQLKHLMRVYAGLLGAANLNQETIKKTNAEIVRTESELSAARTEMMLAHAEILTPDQRKKVRACIAKKMSMPPMMILPPFGPGFKAGHFPLPPMFPHAPVMPGVMDQPPFPPLIPPML